MNMPIAQNKGHKYIRMYICVYIDMRTKKKYNIYTLDLEHIKKTQEDECDAPTQLRKCIWNPFTFSSYNALDTTMHIFLCPSTWEGNFVGSMLWSFR